MVITRVTAARRVGLNLKLTADEQDLPQVARTLENTPRQSRVAVAGIWFFSRRRRKIERKRGAGGRGRVQLSPPLPC